MSIQLVTINLVVLNGEKYIRHCLDGILALVTAIWFLWLVFKKSYANFISAQDSFLVTYLGAAILFVPWVLIYSLTDVALFDERTFLLFIVTISLILANKKLPMGAPKQMR